MIRQHYEIKGIRPYAFSKPTKDKAPTTPQGAVKVALNRVYQNGNGCYAPEGQIKASLECGVSASKMKIEKSNKRALQLVKPLILVEPEEIEFGISIDKVKTVEIPSRTQDDKLIWIVYAYIDEGWKLNFDLVYPELLQQEWVTEAMINAGLLCGIGGKRPRCGLFEVVEAKIV